MVWIGASSCTLQFKQGAAGESPMARRAAEGKEPGLVEAEIGDGVMDMATQAWAMPPDI